MDVSKNICDGECESLFEMKEECKVTCVKLVVWLVVAQKVTNILICNIFEYGAECSAELLL